MGEATDLSTHVSTERSEDSSTTPASDPTPTDPSGDGGGGGGGGDGDGDGSSGGARADATSHTYLLPLQETLPLREMDTAQTTTGMVETMTWHDMTTVYVLI